jgi:hypothetical protein
MSKWSSDTEKLLVLERFCDKAEGDSVQMALANTERFRNKLLIEYYTTTT